MHQTKTQISLRAHGLIRVFMARMKNRCILDFPENIQWKFWTKFAKAQADLSIRCAHMSEGTFSDVAEPSS